jgi:hypothetical protein
VTLLSAARTPAGDAVGLAAWLNEIATYFGDDGQAVVRRLGRVLGKIVSE